MSASRVPGEGAQRTPRSAAPRKPRRPAAAASKASRSAKKPAAGHAIVDPLSVARQAIAEATAALGQAISDGVDGVVSQASAEASAAKAKGLRATIKALEQATAKLSPASASTTRDVLLAAAATAFATKGFDGVSVADIAESAGFTKGAVYSQFGSKEALFFEVVESRIAGPACEAESLSRDDAWDAMMKRTSAAQAESPDSTQLLLALEAVIFGLRHPEARDRMAALFDDIVDRMAQTYFGSTNSKGRQKAISLIAVGDMTSMFAALGVRDAGVKAIVRGAEAVRWS